MLKGLRDLHDLHVKDYISFFDLHELEYSIIVRTKNIQVVGNSQLNISELFDEFISIKITNELKENIDFLTKSINIKTDTINDVKIDCNLLIRYHNIVTFSIDNKIIYMSNIDEDIEKKMKIQEQLKRYQ